MVVPLGRATEPPAGPPIVPMTIRSLMVTASSKVSGCVAAATTEPSARRTPKRGAIARIFIASLSFGRAHDGPGRGRIRREQAIERRPPELEQRLLVRRDPPIVSGVETEEHRLHRLVRGDLRLKPV